MEWAMLSSVLEDSLWDARQILAKLAASMEVVVVHTLAVAAAGEVAEEAAAVVVDIPQ